MSNESSSFPFNQTGQTACEVRCPRMILTQLKNSEANRIATRTGSNGLRERLTELRAACSSVIGAVASMPINIKAAWGCPVHRSAPEEWQPTDGCVKKAQKMGERLQAEGLQITPGEMGILNAAGVEFTHPPEIVG